MKKYFVLILIFSTGLTGYAQKNKKKSTPPAPPVFALQTAEDSLAYAIGVLNFHSLNEDLIKKFSLDVQIEIITKGMTDLSKDTALFDAQQANEFLGIYMMKKEAQLAEAEKGSGKKFLEENKVKPGVTVTQSGLQYEIVHMGSGVRPLATDRVKVHYTGYLIDGTVFDSSVERGEPVVFGLNQVIPGWTEGLQLMPVGSKFKFYIPSELGYGARAAGTLIKPNSTLVFDVELISIEQ